MPENEPLTPAKSCLECEEPLGPGREDRKFCNDACRTSFNNRKRKAATGIGENKFIQQDCRAIQKVYEILLRNRAILDDLSRDNDAQIALRDLLGQGFNLKYRTSEYIGEEGLVYQFCFDLGYRILEGGRVLIICRREEIGD